jgi:hypothetical protein
VRKMLWGSGVARSGTGGAAFLPEILEILRKFKNYFNDPKKSLQKSWKN